MLFSANYYGSLVTTIVSGPMADRFGPKRILMGEEMALGDSSFSFLLNESKALHVTYHEKARE